MIQKFYQVFTLLILTASTCFAGQEPEINNTDSKSKDLKILSWNIYMLPPIAMIGGRVNRAYAIVDTLRNSEFDIIVFQEAFNHYAVKIIRDSLVAIYPYMYGPFNPSHSPLKVSSGVWVISKVKLELKGTIEYNISREFDKVAKKGAALLEGEWCGKRFQIIGTHLQAQNHPDIRRLQIHQMYDSLVNKYKVEGVPQIICGDMNTEIEIEKNYRDMLTGLDAEDGGLSGDQQMTYDGTNNQLALSVWKKAKTTLDYILLRRNGSKIHMIDRHISVFKRIWRKGHTDLSDHYAMACEVRL